MSLRIMLTNIYLYVKIIDKQIQYELEEEC